MYNLICSVLLNHLSIPCYNDTEIRLFKRVNNNVLNNFRYVSFYHYYLSLWFMHNHWKYICKRKFNIRFLTKYKIWFDIQQKYFNIL